MPTVINSASNIGSGAPPSINLSGGPSAMPQPGDLLLAIVVDSSVDATRAPWAAGPGWTLAGSHASGFGGISGNRTARVGVAWRVYQEGGPTTGLTPFAAPATVHNWWLRVLVLRDAGVVTTAFSDGFGGWARTGQVQAPRYIVGDCHLWGAYAFPRSTGSGGQAIRDTWPEPPFTTSNVIGTGFSNMTGYWASGHGEGHVFGPYDASEPFNDAWVTVLLTVQPGRLGRPRLDAPVTLHLGESLSGVFADPSIDVTFFQNVDLDVGSVNEIGDQLSNESWYRFAVRDRSKSRGLVSYTGETLLTRLSRMRPRESLIVVAGEGDVPSPLTLDECLRRFLAFYGVPYKEPLPPFFLRTSTGIVTPTVQAFVIQPDQENPESVFDWLELFFGPFRGYTWRADADDELVVKPPAWAETLGIRFHLYRNSPFQQRSSLTYPWPWPDRAPTVKHRMAVDGQALTGSLGPLEAGVAEEVIEGVLEFEVTWAADGQTLKVERTEPFLNPPVFDAVFIAKPAADAVGGELELTASDLAPDEIETSSADTVYTRSVIPVRERTFQADQPLMQPAALLLKSPEQVAAGAFGANVDFGPMEWEPETPEGFLELANAAAQSGTWFWPIDPEVVPQPGGAVTVAFEVEEWAEQWRGALASAHEPAYQANTYSDSVTVEANGLEVKVLDFEFPAQTSGFPGSFTARGSLYARWRAGDQPGIELTLRNARFVEWGFLWEGLGGQTVYFLWGVVVKLNGAGIAWTVGDLQVARFGFSQNADGTWEGGAEVPGLAEAQRLFPDRVFQSPELPYQVDPATALSIARAVVEENHVPKIVYQLPLAPAREQGWAYNPHHLGGPVTVPVLGVKGRITAHDYTESHSPGGSSSALVVDVEVAQALPDTPAAPTSSFYGAAYYGVSSYHPEEE